MMKVCAKKTHKHTHRERSDYQLWKTRGNLCVATCALNGKLYILQKFATVACSQTSLVFEYNKYHLYGYTCIKLRNSS